MTFGAVAIYSDEMVCHPMIETSESPSVGQHVLLRGKLVPRIVIISMANGHEHTLSNTRSAHHQTKQMLNWVAGGALRSPGLEALLENLARPVLRSEDLGCDPLL